VLSSGKLHILFLVFFGLLKDQKDQKEPKDKRHLVFLMPSWFTKIRHILHLKPKKRHISFLKDSQKTTTIFFFQFLMFFNFICFSLISYVFLQFRMLSKFICLKKRSHMFILFYFTTCTIIHCNYYHYYLLGCHERVAGSDR
jgi:hypothetical protein